MVHFVEADDNSVITSGQPNFEEFTDESAAKARAIELGYVFEEDEEE